MDRLSFLEPEGKVGYRHGPKSGEFEKLIALITDYQEVGRIIDHLKVRFITEIALMTAEGPAEYF